MNQAPTQPASSPDKPPTHRSRLAAVRPGPASLCHLVMAGRHEPGPRLILSLPELWYYHANFIQRRCDKHEFRTPYMCIGGENQEGGQ